jgi:hypothetical protein
MGIIGECLGRGEKLLDAWKASKKVFDDVEVPNKGARYTDGIDDAWKRIMELKKMGYSDIPSPLSSASGDVKHPLFANSGRRN